MFKLAAKVAIVEALRELYDSNYSLDVKPKTVDIEYAEREEQWPFVYVEFNPTEIRWMGIDPDRYIPSGVASEPWTRIRKGHFSGTFTFTVLTLTSEERDRMWDQLVQLFLMGRLHEQTNDFFEKIESHDLIAMTIMEGTVDPVGTSVNPGTPWGTEQLTYEASLSVNAIGQFYASDFSQNLIAISQVESYPAIEGEIQYGEDSRGVWSP